MLGYGIGTMNYQLSYSKISLFLSSSLFIKVFPIIFFSIQLTFFSESKFYAIIKLLQFYNFSKYSKKSFSVRQQKAIFFHKVYNFNYKQMVIRHHLAFLNEQSHNPLDNKATTTGNNSTTSTQKPPAASTTTNSKSTASTTSSNTNTATSNTKTTPSNTQPPPKSATAESSSKTSAPPPPSNATNTKTQSSPPTSSTSTPSTSTSKTTSAPPAVSSSSNSTKASTSPAPMANKTSLTSSSQAQESQPLYHDGRFLGIPVTFLIDLGIVLVVLAIIITIIVIIYRRYRTRKDYNQSPENFAHKPNLGFNEEYYLNHNRIEKCLTPQKITIEEQNPINGKIYQVQFKGTQKSAVYFHRRQNTTSYFEIQVLSINGSVQIGFLPCSNFPKFKTGEENMGSSGVGITNTGFVQAQGQNIYNYSWILAYGDVFGVGLTRQNSKFSQRRAWISKNGVLLNSPPNDEMDKWLATIQITAEQKNQYNLGGEKKDNEEAEDEKQDEQKMKEKAQRQKIEALLKKQRISLKTFNKFEYYPVIVCHGNKDQNKSTVVNVNIGGQIFRMYDSQFRSGLLKDKALFGDD